MHPKAAVGNVLRGLKSLSELTQIEGEGLGPFLPSSGRKRCVERERSYRDETAEAVEEHNDEEEEVSERKGQPVE